MYDTTKEAFSCSLFKQTVQHFGGLIHLLFSHESETKSWSQDVFSLA